MGEGSLGARADARRERRAGTGRAPRDAALPDPAGLLSAAVQRLRAATGCEPVLAWAQREGGGAYLAAAEYAGDAPPEPHAAELDAVARLAEAADLRAEDADPALQRLAARHGCVAAARVGAGGSGPLAVLLVGGAAPPRPRTLAALEAAARRLAAPLATALRLERLDAEARRLDRLAALGTLAAEVAHEVRNPLVSVKTFVQLLPERRDDPEFLSRFAAVVGDELRRMERLLDLVIDQGRSADAAAEGPARIAEAFETVSELLRHRAAKDGVRLETEVGEDVPDAALSGDELRQIVLNLAQNAIAVTPSGRGVRIRAAARDGGVLMSVRDEGPGIPPELRAGLFEPFVSDRAGRPGGLGLAITRRIVEAAGGSIECSNPPGGGAEFRVRLPAAPARPRPGG